jgi:hypothetical protein
MHARTQDRATTHTRISLNALHTPLPPTHTNTHKNRQTSYAPLHRPTPPPPQAAIAKVGESRFYLDLFLVGLLYHLYNQVWNWQWRSGGGWVCWINSVGVGGRSAGWRRNPETRGPSAGTAGDLIACLRSMVLVRPDSDQLALARHLQPSALAVCLQHPPACVPCEPRRVQCRQARCDHLLKVGASCTHACILVFACMCMSMYVCAHVHAIF